MTYKVIVRDPKAGTERYIDNLTKEQSIMEAAKQSDDRDKLVYVSYTDPNGSTGYLNRTGPADNCPGEPW